MHNVTINSVDSLIRMSGSITMPLFIPSIIPSSPPSTRFVNFSQQFTRQWLKGRFGNRIMQQKQSKAEFGISKVDVAGVGGRGRRQHFLLLHQLSQEGVGQDLSGCDALGGLSPQHLSEEVQTDGVHLLVSGGVEVELHLAVVVVNFIAVLALEERSLQQEDVQDHACGEDVALGGNFLALLEGGDFGGDVAGSPAAVVEVVLGVDISGKSEVHDDWFQSSAASEHDVFGLDVAVHDSEFVHFLEPTGQSVHELLDFGHGEFGLFLVDAGVELSVSEEFHDQVEGVVGFEDAFEFEQVGAVPGSHEFDFIEEGLPVDGVGGKQGAGFGEGLDGESLLVGGPFDFVDGGGGTFSKFADWFVETMESNLIELLAEVLLPQRGETEAGEVEIH